MVIRQPGRAGHHLANYSQKMADGRVRDRNVLPSTKMLSKDDPKHACIHGMIKEFSPYITEEHKSAKMEMQVVVEEGSLVAWEEIIDSPSFPSLTTQYKMHQLTVRAARGERLHTPLLPTSVYAFCFVSYPGRPHRPLGCNRRW